LSCDKIQASPRKKKGLPNQTQYRTWRIRLQR
jgi:hypothetical protein